jgi:hypothetical protein
MDHRYKGLIPVYYSKATQIQIWDHNSLGGMVSPKRINFRFQLPPKISYIKPLEVKKRRKWLTLLFSWLKYFTCSTIK